MRGVQISDDGQMLYSISADRSIKGINTGGAVAINYPNAHKSSINRCLILSQTGLATGDDAGHVKIWDLRSPMAVMEYEMHEDFISGFAYKEEKFELLSTSGDYTLGVYDVRKPTADVRSDEQESELNCVEIIKGGRKAICGTQDGVLLIFSDGRWGDCSDRFPGHPDSVDCMLKIDESTIVTGSSDGLIRVVSVQPNKVLGIIGDHEEFPVEGLRPNYDNTILASFAHDEVIRFWDLSMFQDENMDGDDEDEEVAQEDNMRVADMDEEDEDEDDGAVEMSDADDSDENDGGDDSDSDSDSDESERGNGGMDVGKRVLPTAREKFFADL